MIEREGALCPLHSSPAALSSNCFSSFFDSLSYPPARMQAGSSFWVISLAARGLLLFAHLNDAVLTDAGAQAAAVALVRVDHRTVFGVGDGVVDTDRLALRALFALGKIGLREIARHTVVFFHLLEVAAGLAKMMGHSNLRSTQVYAVITDDKISKDMDKLMQRRETKETDQNKNKEDGK